MAIGPRAGSCGTAAYLQQPVFSADILTDQKWVKFRDLAKQAGLRAAWSNPILSHDGKVLGTLGMYYRKVRHPRPDEIHLIEYATRIAGIAIEREQSQSALRVPVQSSRGVSSYDISSTQSVKLAKPLDRTDWQGRDH